MAVAKSSILPSRSSSLRQGQWAEPAQAAANWQNSSLDQAGMWEIWEKKECSATPTMEARLVDLTPSWGSKGGEMSPTEGVEARVRVWDWGLRRGAW